MELFIFLPVCVVVGLVVSVLLYSCVRVQKRALLNSDPCQQEQRSNTSATSSIYTVPTVPQLTTMFPGFDKLPSAYNKFHSSNYIVVPPPPSYDEATADSGHRQIENQQRMYPPSLVR